VACNHARGTLVRADAPGPWADLAARYPDATHAQIAAAAGEAPSARFACFHDYTDDLAANLANVPAGTTSIRGAIHAPDGPLRAGAPRPDTTANRFCLDCHTEEGRGGLGLEALAARPDLDAEHDPRRQPLQPPRRVFGNVPAGWISPGPGPGGPATHVQAPPEGLLIDRWVLPSASP
jgi:hypothetical protein